MPQVYFCMAPAGHLDLARPPRAARVAQIAAGYTDAPLAAAMRGGFYDTRTGVPVGLAWNWGGRNRIQSPTGLDWPCLVLAGGTARIVRESTAREGWVAGAAGPQVLAGGRADARDQTRFRDIGWTARRPRTAIGVYPGGERVILAAFAAATVAEVRDYLLYRGCADGLLYDGGTGTEWWAGGQSLTFGGAPARVPWAWVVRATPRPDLPPGGWSGQVTAGTERWPQEAPAPPGGSAPPARQPRLQWGPGLEPLPGPVQYLVVHHTATGDVPIEEVHRWHRERGWAGVGFHALIRSGGTVEWGRPLEMKGAHVLPVNSRSLAVCLAGDFDRGAPAGQQLTSLRWLLGQWRALHPGARVAGHGEFDQTTCPGSRFPLAAVKGWFA